MKFVLFFEKKKGFFSFKKKKDFGLLIFLKNKIFFDLNKDNTRFNQIKLKEKILVVNFKGLRKREGLRDKKNDLIDHFILIKLKLGNFFNNRIVFKKRFPFFIRLENLISSKRLFNDSLLILKNLFLFENFVLKEKKKRQKYKDLRL
jgi:hypothetical protein